MTLQASTMRLAAPTWTEPLEDPPQEGMSSLFKIDTHHATSVTQLVVAPPTIAHARKHLQAGEVQRATTQGILLPEETYVATTYPEPLRDDASVRHLLTNRVKQSLNWLLDLLRSHAQLSQVSVIKVEVTGLADPEEPFEELIVRQWVDLGGEQALDYWDQLGAAIEAWSRFLPDYLETIVCERIAVQVWWDTSRDVL